MTESKVSIIIPVYNVAPYIEHSLNTALTQTYNDIEYVVVDDCGTDNSMDIIARMVAEHPKKNIRIVKHKNNKGLSGARNTGVTAATGEYLFFMDADDVITPDCIEKQMTAITEYNADVVDGSFDVIGGRNIFNEVQQTIYTNNKTDIQRFYFNSTLHISACNKLIRSSFIRDIGLTFTEGLIYEDTEWTLSLAKYASSIVLIPDKTYKYIIRGNSITTSFSERHIKSMLYLNRMYVDYINNCNEPELNEMAKRFFSERRFKISTLIIIASTLDFKIKKEYYNRLNAPEFRAAGSGIYGMLTKLPFWMFCLFFYLPRRIFAMLLLLKR